MNAIESEHRDIVQSAQSNVLTNIYQEKFNMAVWQRTLPIGLTTDVAYLLQKDSTFQHAAFIFLETIQEQVSQLFNSLKPQITVFQGVKTP